MEEGDSSVGALSLTAAYLPCGTIHTRTSLPVGFSLTPLSPIPANQVLKCNALQCAQCGGFIGPHCDVRHLRGVWRCGICGADNRDLTLATDPAALALRPELTGATVEYVLQPASSSSQSGMINDYDAPLPPLAVLFLIDDTASACAVNDLLSAARDALPLLPPQALVGLLSFGQAVSVYLLDEGSNDLRTSVSSSEALCFSAIDSPSALELDQLRSYASVALRPRQACGEQVLRAIEALSAPIAPSWIQPQADKPGHAGERCLLTAIDIATTLIQQVLSDRKAPMLTSQTDAKAPMCCTDLIITLAGPHNLGPGALPTPVDASSGHPAATTPARSAALEALRDTGRRLSRSGVRAHVTCSDAHAVFDAAALRAMVMPCSGVIEIERQPGTQLAAIRRRTSLCELYSSATCAQPQRGLAGVLSVRCSRGMRVARVVGAALSFQKTDAAPGESGDDGVCFVGVLHQASCLSISLDTSAVADSDGPESTQPGGHSAVVQAALRYESAGGERRLRVFTACTSFTSKPSRFLASLDVDATALLAARLAALDACAMEMTSHATNALAAAAAVLAKNWVEAHGSLLTTVREGWLWNRTVVVGYSSSEPALTKLLCRLYALGTSAAAHRRGVDADAAHAARLLLLTAPPGIAPACTRPVQNGSGGVDTAMHEWVGQATAPSLQTQPSATYLRQKSTEDATVATNDELTLEQWCDALSISISSDTSHLHEVWSEH